MPENDVSKFCRTYRYLSTPNMPQAQNMLLDFVSVGTWRWNMLTGDFFCDEICADILGYTKEDIENKKILWANLISGEHIHNVECSIMRDIADNGRYNLIITMIKKDASSCYIRESGKVTKQSSHGIIEEVSGILEDIGKDTDFKSEILQKVKERDDIVSAMGITTWSCDISTGNVTFSRGLGRKLGYPKGEITFQKFLGLIHSADISKVTSLFNQIFAGDITELVIDYRVNTRDKNYIWLSTSAYVSEYSEANTPLKIWGYINDVDRIMRHGEQLENKLKEKEKYSSILKTQIDNTLEKLEFYQRTSKVMIDTSPSISLIVNKNLLPIDCNTIAYKRFGFANKSDFLTNIRQISKKMDIRDAQSNAAIDIDFVLKAAFKAGDREREVIINFDGASAPFNVTIKRIMYMGEYSIVIYMIELTQLKQAQNQLIKNEQLLKSVNMVAEKLMSADAENFERTLSRSLKTIAEVTGVDKVYICSNFEKNGELFCKNVFEWPREKLAPHMLWGLEQLSYKTDMPSFYRVLNYEQTINALTENVPPKEKSIIQSAKALSVLIIPVFIKSRFWGFVGFDKCNQASVFTKSEVSILHSAGILLVSAIQRNEILNKLIEAKEFALESARAKTDFLSRISHEIRTPMNAIIGMAALARKTGDIEKLRNYINKIDNASTQLLSLINSVLDMSKIESGKLEIYNSEFSFEKMLLSVLNVIQLKSEEKHQTISITFKDIFIRNIISDELRLSQVMINLLNNAVKFTPKLGEISIYVDYTCMNDNCCLHVEVKDSGIGMSQEQQKKLFYAFEQTSEEITRRYGGTGLGLVICKKIVNAMGGDIWVESEPDKGAKFIFEVNIRMGKEIYAKAVKDIALRQKHVLVIGDDSQEIQCAIKFLNKFSAQCDIAYNYCEAMQCITNLKNDGKDYDILVIDSYDGAGKAPEETYKTHIYDIVNICENAKNILLITSTDEVQQIEEIKQCTRIGIISRPVLPSAICEKLSWLNNKTPSNNTDKMHMHNKWAGKTILLVEDIEINREIIEGILEDTGVRIECAEDGAQAVNMYKSNYKRYNLVLMDIQMPVMDGIAATKIIRAMDISEAHSVPIIAMTANAFKEDIKQCIDAGMDAHVAKPIDTNNLIETIAKYLRAH